ncbi:MAG: ABC transporter permease [Bryobacteraceae bacterium]|nr:ABC transporter permease [Bryobacteraceae bacterium]
MRRFLSSQYFVLWVSLLYAAVMAPFTPAFLSPENALNILSSMLPLLIVAAGQTIILITGGIDLSVTSVIALASVLGAMTMTSTSGNVVTGIAVMLAAGALVGLINGIGMSAGRMPPFMVTLATMMFFGGFAVWITKSKNVGGLPRNFNAIGDSLPAVALIAIAIIAVLHFVLSRTTAGRWLYATGRNPRTALVSGVPVRLTTTAAYVVSGLLAAVASVIYTGRLETGSPVLGQRILLDVIAAVVIGGCSLFGGRGTVLWTVLGVLFITLVDNTLNLTGVSNFAVLIAKGGVILMAALLDTVRTRYATH